MGPHFYESGPQRSGLRAFVRTGDNHFHLAVILQLRGEELASTPEGLARSCRGSGYIEKQETFPRGLGGNCLFQGTSWGDAFHCFQSVRPS